MPYADPAAMTAHLAEIGATVDPGAHAVVIPDQAGWHMSKKLAVLGNIAPPPLPTRAPELNPVENPGSGSGQAVWQFLRDNGLSNRASQSHDDIVAHCCDAWNKLIDRPWRIITLGMRDWAS